MNLVENKAAIAIGTAFQASEDLYMQGMRGKAVNILHCVGKIIVIFNTYNSRLPGICDLKVASSSPFARCAHAPRCIFLISGDQLWLSGNQTDIPQLGQIEHIEVSPRHNGVFLPVYLPETKETLSPDEPKNDNADSEGILNINVQNIPCFYCRISELRG